MVVATPDWPGRHAKIANTPRRVVGRHAAPANFFNLE
jgi:hypothetical protein